MGWLEIYVTIQTSVDYYKEEDWLFSGYFAGQAVGSAPKLAVENYNFIAESFGFE
jgi:hypothetical protein